MQQEENDGATAQDFQSIHVDTLIVNTGRETPVSPKRTEKWSEFIKVDSVSPFIFYLIFFIFSLQTFFITHIKVVDFNNSNNTRTMAAATMT